MHRRRGATGVAVGDAASPPPRRRRNRSGARSSGTATPRRSRRRSRECRVGATGGFASLVSVGAGRQLRRASHRADEVLGPATAGLPSGWTFSGGSLTSRRRDEALRAAPRRSASLRAAHRPVRRGPTTSSSTCGTGRTNGSSRCRSSRPRPTRRQHLLGRRAPRHEAVPPTLRRDADRRSAAVGQRLGARLRQPQVPPRDRLRPARCSRLLAS